MRWDVVIAGAGPAGARLGALVARSGRRVLLLHRNSAIKHLLECLPSHIARSSGDLPLYRPCTSNRSSWGGRAITERPGILRPLGHDWFVDRSAFDYKLREDASCAGAVVISASLSALKRDGASWSLALSNGTDVVTDFLVDATGRASFVGLKIGAKRISYDRLVATVIGLEGRVPHADVSTLVAATPDGWVYVGPGHSADAYAMVFTDADLPIYRTLSSIEGTQRFLDGSEAFPDCRAASILRRVSAVSGWLQPAAGPQWLALGDAAASLDPLSSQGLESAWDNAEAAHQAIQAQDVGNYEKRMADRRRLYLHNRTRVYRRERRWPSSEFWWRRRRDGLFC